MRISLGNNSSFMNAVVGYKEVSSLFLDRIATLTGEGRLCHNEQRAQESEDNLAASAERTV